MIKEIINPEAPAIKPPVWLCDNCLGDHIPFPLPRTHFMGLIIGASGSGKSSFVHSILTQKEPRIYRKCFHKIFLFIPPNSLESIKKSPFKSHPKDRIFHELTEANLQKVYDSASASSSEGENTFIWVDDMGSDLKNLEVQRLLRTIVWNKRHLKISALISLQSYVSCPTSIRRNANFFVTFKPRSKIEGNLIFEELIQLAPQEQEELYRTVFKEKHDFLMGFTDTGQLFRNFNLLDIE